MSKIDERALATPWAPPRHSLAHNCVHGAHTHRARTVGLMNIVAPSQAGGVLRTKLFWVPLLTGCQLVLNRLQLQAERSENQLARTVPAGSHCKPAAERPCCSSLRSAAVHRKPCAHAARSRADAVHYRRLGSRRQRSLPLQQRQLNIAVYSTRSISQVQTWRCQASDVKSAGKHAAVLQVASTSICIASPRRRGDSMLHITLALPAAHVLDLSYSAT